MRPVDASEVARAQRAWGDALVNLSGALHDGGREGQAARAAEELLCLYDLVDLESGTSGLATPQRRILFVPELARIRRARTTLTEVLSYYAATNGACGEDAGLARRRRWCRVRFRNEAVVVHDATTVTAYGRYTLTADDDATLTAQFVFSYVRRRAMPRPRRGAPDVLARDEARDEVRDATRDEVRDERDAGRMGAEEEDSPLLEGWVDDNAEGGEGEERAALCIRVHTAHLASEDVSFV